jgi:hypothetical protein
MGGSQPIEHQAVVKDPSFGCIKLSLMVHKVPVGGIAAQYPQEKIVDIVTQDCKILPILALQTVGKQEKMALLGFIQYLGKLL